MKIVEQKYIAGNKLDQRCDVYFIQIDPEKLSTTLMEILNNLRDKSWLKKIDDENTMVSYQQIANNTCEYLENKFRDLKDDSELKKSAGEYIVSNLAKKCLVEELHHNDIPLMELLGRKDVGNPSFDFYTEIDFYLVAGEAKYKKDANPYNDALKQILEFISKEKRKYIGDFHKLKYLATDKSMINMRKGKFHVCAAFSITQIDTDKLINNILANEHFKKCVSSHTIFLVAVQMYGK